MPARARRLPPSTLNADPAAASATSSKPLPLPLSPTALSSLTTEHRILHLLHHRSRNQHRRSHWWRHLGSLRRLLRDLLRAHHAEAKADASAFPRRHPSAARVGPDAASRPSSAAPPAPPPPPLIAFIRRLPAWHASFTSLLASGSGQFAPLGLALLGVLARVCGAIGVVRWLEGPEGRGAVEREEERGWREALRRFEGEGWLNVDLDGGVAGVRRRGGGEGKEGGRERVEQGEGKEQDEDCGVVVVGNQGTGRWEPIKPADRGAVRAESEATRGKLPGVVATVARNCDEASADKRKRRDRADKPKSSAKAKSNKGDAIDELFRGLV